LTKQKKGNGNAPKEGVKWGTDEGAFPYILIEMPASISLSFGITLPQWLREAIEEVQNQSTTEHDRMEFAIKLARLNIERGGGPFAALVFNQDTCVGVGVNRVTETGLSIAHAEILSLMSAQTWFHEQKLPAVPLLSMYTTTEPCCQCYGALIWSSVNQLYCAATTADAEAIGFDEGPKPTDWVEELEHRKMSVFRELCRESAVTVLRDYQARGGPIYGKR
jgi:tRNA(Arg) A34 adenosine deaminase TadA